MHAEKKPEHLRLKIPIIEKGGIIRMGLEWKTDALEFYILHIVQHTVHDQVRTKYCLHSTRHSYNVRALLF